jgi:hypothetical protein
MNISLDLSPAPPVALLKKSKKSKGKKILAPSLSFRKQLGMARKKEHVRNIIDGLSGLSGFGRLVGLKRSRTCDNLQALVEAATGSD